MFASTSLEITSSSISDLRLFVRLLNLLLDVNGDAERLKFYRYGLSDLASSDRFWNFYQGRQEENSPRDYLPGCDVFDNGRSYNRLPSDVDNAVRLLFPGILVLVLLSMLVDYFNG